jgi:hypothetical protein
MSKICFIGFRCGVGRIEVNWLPPTLSSQVCLRSITSKLRNKNLTKG